MKALRIQAISILLLLGAPARALADSWDRDAVYARRVAELRQEIARRPMDARPLVELAAFYLKPLAPREVEAADGKKRTFLVPLRGEVTPRIKNIYAVPWVFRGDTGHAFPLLKQALALEPNHAGATREMAMYYRMRGDLDKMRPYMEAALRNDPSDLDMCRLYLDHRTGLASVLNDQATALRTPTTREEQRADGVYKVTTYPGDWDRARADALDARAKEARREAIQPLHDLAGRLKNDPTRASDPAKNAKWRLATAIYLHWIGDLEKAAGTSMAGLREDPTHLDSLDFIIDLLRGTHTNDKHREYKAILDRWGGADSSPTFIETGPAGPKR